MLQHLRWLVFLEILVDNKAFYFSKRALRASNKCNKWLKYFMSINDDIADIEKPDGICLPTFIEDKLQDYFYIHQSFLLYIQDLHK